MKYFLIALSSFLIGAGATEFTIYDILVAKQEKQKEITAQEVVTIMRYSYSQGYRCCYAASYECMDSNTFLNPDWMRIRFLRDSTNWTAMQLQLIDSQLLQMEGKTLRDYAVH